MSRRDLTTSSILPPGEERGEERGEGEGREEGKRGRGAEGRGERRGGERGEERRGEGRGEEGRGERRGKEGERRGGEEWKKRKERREGWWEKERGCRKVEVRNGEEGEDECQHSPLHSSVCMRNSALPCEVCEGGHPAEAT